MTIHQKPAQFNSRPASLSDATDEQLIAIYERTIAHVRRLEDLAGSTPTAADALTLRRTNARLDFIDQLLVHHQLERQIAASSIRLAQMKQRAAVDFSHPAS